MIAMRRWVCPICREGRLAPGRARRDDTRTYCLSCSDKSSHLVRRVCEAAERERARAKETERAAKRQQAELNAVRRAQYRSLSRLRTEQATRVEGYSLEPFIVPLWRACRASVYAREDCPLAAPSAEFNDRRGHGMLGVMKSSKSVRIYTKRARSFAGALTTLLHELAHCAQPPKSPNHGAIWQSLLAGAACKVLPGWEPPAKALRKTWRVVDDAIEIEIARRIGAGLSPIEAGIQP